MIAAFLRNPATCQMKRFCAVHCVNSNVYHVFIALCLATEHLPERRVQIPAQTSYQLGM